MWKSLSVLLLLAVAIHQALLYATQKTYPVHGSGGILVTGASSGIGRHAAISLARQGYTVFAGCRKQNDMESLSAEGVSTLRPIIIDVTKEKQIDEAYHKIEAELGGKPFVALVNNAGMEGAAPVELLEMQAVRTTFEVNYFGVLQVTKKFIPLLRKAGKGARIVHVSSVAGLMSSPGGTPYAATKFAVEAMNDALRIELAPWGITSSVINPAFVATEIFGKVQAHRDSDMEKYTAEQKSLYKHLINDNAKKMMLDMVAKADTPAVTTEAITHAITSPQPQLRYVVANIDGTPAWVFHWMKWILPAQVFDAITLATMGIKS